MYLYDMSCRSLISIIKSFISMQPRNRMPKANAHLDKILFKIETFSIYFECKSPDQQSARMDASKSLIE